MLANYVLLFVTVVATAILSIEAATLGKWEGLSVGGIMPHKVLSHACENQANLIYVYGGRVGKDQISNALLVFNENTKNWSRGKIVGDAPKIYGHTMTRVGDKLYIFGGKSIARQTAPALNTLYSYDLEKGVLTLIPTPGVAARSAHTAVAINRFIVIYGGTHSGSTLSSAVIYDTESNEWIDVPDAPSASQGHSAVVIGKRMYVFGGFDGQSSTDRVLVLELEILNNSFKWTTLPAQGVRRSFHTSSLVGNKVVVYGGLNETGYISETSVFDLSTDEWGDNIVDGKRMEARQGHCAVSLDNQVYVFGGSHTWEHVFNDIVVLRNPASQPSRSSVVTTGDESFSDSLTRKLYESTLMMTAGYSPTELTADQIKDMIAAEAKLRKDIDEDHDATYLSMVAEALLSWKKAEPIYENIQKLKAEFAKTHLNITAQLALIDEAVKEHNEYNDAITKMTKEFAPKLSALRQLEDEAAYAIRKSTTVKQEHEQLRETLAQEIKKMEVKKSQVKVKEVNVALLKQKKADLNKRLGQLRVDHKSSETSIADKESKIADLDNRIDQLAKSLAAKTRERDEWVQKSVDLESALHTLITELATTKLRKETAKRVKALWEISKKSLNEYEDEFDEAERYEQANAPFSTLNDALKHEEEKVGRLEQDAVRSVSVIESQIKSKQEEIAAHKKIELTANFDHLLKSKTDLEKQRSNLQNEIETLKQQTNKYFGNIAEAEQSSKSAAEKYETDTLELATAITDRDWHVNHVKDLERELALKGKAIQEAQNNESKCRNKLRTEELALRNEFDNLHRTSQFVQNANIRILGLRQQIYDAHSYFTNARENIAKQVALLKEVVDNVESIALQKYKDEIETLKRRNADLEQEIAQLRFKPAEQEPVVEENVAVKEVVEEKKAVQEEKLVTEHRHVVVDETVVTDVGTGKVVEDKVNITESITSVNEEDL